MSSRILIPQSGSPLGAGDAKVDSRLRAIASAEPPLPVLDCYRMSSLLGRGPIAEVFLAAWQVSPEIVRPVAVKRLYNLVMGDECMRRDCVSEAMLACQLEHENIVRTHEIGLIAGRICIAMEYLAGQTVQLIMRRAWNHGGLPVPFAVRVALEALAGLTYAHRFTDSDGHPVTILHLNLCPQNLFVTNSGQVKILNFAVAKATSRAQRTLTGIAGGSFAYVAPEQTGGLGVDASTDLWSLGVVLWEMLGGTRLFKADGEAATLHAVLHREIPFLTEVRPDVPRELAVAVSRALQRSPDHRYGSAAAMAEALLPFASEKTASQTAMQQQMRHWFCGEFQLQRDLVNALVQSSGSQQRSVDSLGGLPATTMPSHAGPPGPDSARPAALAGRTRIGIVVGILLALLVAGFIAVNIIIPALTTSTWFSRRHIATSSIAPRAWRGLLPNDHLSLVRHELPADATQLGHAESLIAPPLNVASRSMQIEEVTDYETVAAEIGAASPADDSVPPSASASRTDSLASPELVGGARMMAVPVPHFALPATLGKKASTATEGSSRAAESAIPVDPSLPPPIDAFGYLSIDSSPWANVYCEGRLLGSTPVIRARLPVGTYLLSLRNTEDNLESHLSVEIEPNRNVVKRLGLK